jgi:tRNA threonylcarbamoyladenosine biosynthesis protein TsaB
VENNKQTKKVLAIDTSTATLAVAVQNEAGQIFESNTQAERNHSIHMMKGIEDTLKKAGLTIKDMELIAVGIGPGSYTGIRIAVTTAKTLAWSLNIPIVGVSSLAATALGSLASALFVQQAEYEEISELTHNKASHWVIPLVDARRGQVYTGLYQLEQGDFSEQIPLELESDRITLMTLWCENLANKWEDLKEEDKPSGIWFVGETTEMHTKTIIDTLGDKLGDALHIFAYELGAKWIGQCGEHAFEQGQHDEAHTLVPNYTQLAEAEAALLARK